MFTIIKNCYKSVLTIVGIITIMTALVAFYTNFATSAEVKQLREDTKQDIAMMRTEFKKSMELDRNITRLNNTNENLLRTRLLLMTRPNDKDLLEDYEILKKDKEKLQKAIDKR